MTPDDANAAPDDITGSGEVVKKIPDVADIDGQINALSGALASAALTATDMPLHMLQPMIGAMAEQLVAFGVRQTEHVDPDAIHAPAWITDGARQRSMKVPEQPEHTEAEPFVAMTATAPEPPKRIAKAARAAPL